jgi:very-short-patch-repair endonuclease
MPFTTADALAVETRGRLYGPDFQPLLHGTRMVAVEVRTHSRLMIAFRRKYGPEPVFGGPTAAWAHGCHLAEPAMPIVVLGDRARTTRHLVRRRSRLDPEDVVLTRWGRVTSTSRTAVDLARGVGTSQLTHLGRVVWVDALLRATCLPAAQARSAVVPAAGLHGLDMAGKVLRDARDGVDSPKETELRLLIQDAGFPEPRTQCPVVVDGRVVARLDLGWEEYRAGAEYDGAVHLERRQHSIDLDRHNGIRVAGWNVLQVDQRLLRRRDRLVDRLSRLVPRR